MTDREVMQMALWAIEDSGHKSDLMAAADALRAALAEPVQEPVAPARRPLTSNKDVPGAIYVDGYGYVDIKAVRAIERAHNITGGNDE